MQKLTIVLPCHNEAEAIPVVIPQTLEFLAAQNQFSYEVIVVNDGSTDDSAKLLATYSNIKLLQLPERSGYGFALKQGFAAATGDFIAFSDLDGTCHVQDILRLCQRLKDQHLDLIWGIRLHESTNMPWIRQLGNQMYSFLLRRIYRRPVHDSCSGLRVFQASQKDWMNELPNGLDFSLAMTVNCLKNNLRFEEHPITYKSRLGDSKLKALVHGFTFLKTLLVFAFRT